MNGRTSSKQLIIDLCQVSIGSHRELTMVTCVQAIKWPLSKIVQKSTCQSVSIFNSFVNVLRLCRWFFLLFFSPLFQIVWSVHLPTLCTSAYYCLKGNLALQFFVSVGNELTVKHKQQIYKIYLLFVIYVRICTLILPGRFLYKCWW